MVIRGCNGNDKDSYRLGGVQNAVGRGTMYGMCAKRWELRVLKASKTCNRKQRSFQGGGPTIYALDTPIHVHSSTGVIVGMEGIGV